MHEDAAKKHDVGRVMPAALFARPLEDGGHGPPYPYRRGSDCRRAFSLVEIMVVVGILALLIGIVFKGGGAMITRAKVRDTEAMLKTLNQAIDAYKGEVNQSRVANAQGIFLGFPPDNPGVFQAGGINITGCPVKMAQQGVIIDRGTTVTDGMLDDRGANGQLTTLDPKELNHGDIRAMVLAMRLRSPKASAILDRIDPRFKASDEDHNAIYDPDPSVTGDEIQLEYYVDAWGTPLEYFCTCPCVNGSGPQNPREDTAKYMVHANNAYPVLVSYGPNGPDQLSKDFMDTFGDTTIVGDYYSMPDGTLTKDGMINHELNDDNIYSADGLKERLRTGS